MLLHRVQPGQQAREELFDLSPDWTHLNHGSYGATLRYTMRLQTLTVTELLRFCFDGASMITYCREA